MPPEANEPSLKTEVVNVQAERYDVYIGRARPGFRAVGWGNPFQIGKDGTREQVIDKYRSWIRTQPELMARLPELRHKRLGCWCKPDACHGDVLLELLGERPEPASRPTQGTLF